MGFDLLPSNILQLSCFWYHGTTSNSLKTLNTVNPSKGRPYTDFGQGFYLTSNWFHAYSQACRVTNFAEDDSTPVVVVFKINTELLNKLNGSVFLDSDDLWSEFIYKRRVERTMHTLDYVFGPVADGNMSILVRDAKKNKITKSNFMKNICPKGKHSFPNNHQLSIHTDEASKYLKKMEVFDIGTGTWKQS